MNNTCNTTDTIDLERTTTAATMPPSDEPMIDTPITADIETAEPSRSSCGKYYWCSTKALELVICIIPWFLGIGLEFATPYQRPIPYQVVDENIVNAFMYNIERHGETVPTFVMFVAAVVIPLVIQLSIIGCSRRLSFNKVDMIHKTVCVYSMAIGLTQSLTNFAKVYCGYFRPIFLDLCQPDENWECTASSNELHQGRVSFVSGHASLSICGTLLFSYFLVDTYGHKAFQKANPTAGEESVGLRRIGSVFCYAPMLVGYFIGTLLAIWWRSESNCRIKCFLTVFHLL